ncbi:putative reverse transcriptase domain-containing protein [Tanacetum coccineum]
MIDINTTGIALTRTSRLLRPQYCLLCPHAHRFAFVFLAWDFPQMVYDDGGGSGAWGEWGGGSGRSEWGSNFGLRRNTRRKSFPAVVNGGGGGRVVAGHFGRERERSGESVKGNDVPAYTNRFQELALMCTKFVANEKEKVDKYISGLPDNIYGNVKYSKPKTLDETIELANDLMDQKLRTYAKRQIDNKRKAGDSSRNNHGHQQQPFKRQNVTKVYNMGTCEKKSYGGSLPKCTKCHFHHNGPCTQKCHKCNKVGHFARDYISAGNTNVANAQRDNRAIPKGNGCFECGAPRHFKKDCPKLDNKNGGSGNAQDLMPVELGIFDIIIGIDWLRKYHAVIVCDEKLVRIPYGDETLIFCGDESNDGRESRLTIISCSKAQEYMVNGCQVFLAHISAKKEEDKSDGKQLKGVPIVRDFPKVFPEDLPGLPPA